MAMAAEPDRAPLPISLKRAVELALSPEGNPHVQIAEENVKQAKGRSAEARAALLPDLESSVTEQDMTRSLAAFGFDFKVPIPGFQIPQFVGPFRVFDARATVNQNIVDFSSIRRYQASKLGIKAAKSDTEKTEDDVAAQVAKAYLAALRADADIDAINSNVDLANAVLKTAENQKAAGTGTGIEITRARVQLSNEKQRLLVARNARRQAYLQLLRAMNLRLDAAVELTDKLAYTPVDPATLDGAAAEAINSRADLRAQEERESNAQLNSSATKLERLPSVMGFGDYGSIGIGITNARPTRTVGVSLRVPVFDGGRREARRAESGSVLRQEHLRTADLKEQIQLDVQLAIDAMRSAQDEVTVAEEGLTLSESELAQARRRYEAGFANSLEVTDAQNRLARARDNRIAALFNYNQARIDLGQATGTIRRMLQ
jgi:outer membrane protein TolC